MGEGWMASSRRLRPGRGIPVAWSARAALGLAALLAAGCGDSGELPEFGGSGTIEATQVEVAPLAGGRILELSSEEGTTVQAGQLLARIDDADLRIGLQQVQAQAEGARAALSLVQEGARQEDVRQAQAGVSRARAELEAAEADRRRIAGLHSRGSATDKQLDDGRTREEVARAGLESAAQLLEKLQRGSRSQEIRASRAALDAAEAQVALLEKRLADCLVLAPISGVVTSKVREAGEVVSPGATLLTISRLESVWLTLYLPETQIGRVRLGQPARVLVDSHPGRAFTGRVIYVSPEAEFTPRNIQTRDERVKLVYAVKVGIDNPEGIFKPGMPADAELVED